MTETEEQREGGIDPQLVERLGEIVARLSLSEIEVKHGDLAIRISRQNNVVAPAAAPTTSIVVAPQPTAAPPVAVEHAGTVKSPMVGTAYLRPAPNTAPFVAIGTAVKSGDKILLIEAMKTFNEIIAPRGGTVIEILVEDGQPVEYGQPLLVIA